MPISFPAIWKSAGRGARRFRDLVREIGEDRVLTSEADLLTYSYDGALDRRRPEAVVLARTADDVRRAVAWCAARRIPFVARGAGTNLSGGCIPARGGVVISLARMNRILGIDTAKRLACVEPGVVNLSLQEALAPLGFFYAPDPASHRVCTLGGNAAENAGGPRCLKYGVTANHVAALEAVMPDGTEARFSVSDAGPELMGLLVGAEGTLGVITKLWLRILPVPAAITTILAGFDSMESAVECVSEIIAAGILPRVLEAMDRMTVESVEAYRPAGYPAAEAVLLIELDGPEAEIERQAGEVERLCRKHGCVEHRRAVDSAERERLWEGRRGAYAAVARIAPNVLVEDGVVPRGRLAEAYRRVREIAERHGIRVAMLFHAGDGNLHPNIAFDERDLDETRRVKSAGFEILRACVELGGSISGEHGIGIDKRRAMAWLFSPETLGLFDRVRKAVDPAGISNPDKVLPLPDESASERRMVPAHKPFSPAAMEIIDKVRRAAAEKRTVEIAGLGTKIETARGGARIPSAAAIELSARGLREILELDRSNYTATVEAGIGLRELKDRLRREGFHAAVPDAPGSLGGLWAAKGWAGLRDHVIGMRILLASGETAEWGGKVVKNVAGYDVSKLLLGSWGALAIILDMTLKLYPFEPETPGGIPRPGLFSPTPWQRKIKEAFDPENRLNPWVFGDR